ncbi:DUF4382 domain-containing protein [Natrialbaceae archaeon A-gly3]
MDEPNDVRRREYLKLTGATATASAVGLAGCLGDDTDGTDGDATGTLATQVTDQPGDIGDFESCVVTIQGIWLKPADGEEGGDDDAEADDGENETDDGEQTDDPNGDDEELEEQDEDDIDTGEGREYHAFDEPQQADLVDLQGENTQLVDERDLPVREYEFLQLDVTEVEGTLEDGGDVEVSTPGNAPLQFKERFEIREGEVTTFVADFVPVRRGQTGSYLIKPVAQGTKVLYGDEEYELEDEETGDDADGDTDDTDG